MGVLLFFQYQLNRGCTCIQSDYLVKDMDGGHLVKTRRNSIYTYVQHYAVSLVNDCVRVFAKHWISSKCCVANPGARHKLHTAKTYTR